MPVPPHAGALLPCQSSAFQQRERLSESSHICYFTGSLRSAPGISLFPELSRESFMNHSVARRYTHTHTRSKIGCFQTKNLGISFLWWNLAQLYIHKDKQSQMKDGAEKICKKKKTTTQYSGLVVWPVAVYMGLNFAYKQMRKGRKCSLQSQKGCSQEAGRCRLKRPTAASMLLDVRQQICNPFPTIFDMGI